VTAVGADRPCADTYNLFYRNGRIDESRAAQGRGEYMSANARITVATLLLVLLGLPAAFWSITLTVEIVKASFTADVKTNVDVAFEQVLVSAGWLICALSICGAVLLLRARPRAPDQGAAVKGASTGEKIFVTAVFVVFALPPGLCSMIFMPSLLSLFDRDNRGVALLYGVPSLLGLTVFGGMLWWLIWTWQRGLS